MIQVQGPDGGIVEFPDETSLDVIKGVMAKKFGAPKQASQSTASGAFDAFTQGASLGFGDELTALESAVLGRKPGGGTFDLGNYDRPFAERYKAALGAERGQQDKFAEEQPIVAGAANMAGSLATGMGAGRAGLTLMRPGAANMTARGAAEGAAYGAAYGAGEADEGDRLAGAGYGAAVGGAVGGALTSITQQIARLLSNRSAAAAAPSVQSLKGQAGAAYDRARAANPTFGGFDQWVMQAYQKLPDEGYHPNLHPQLKVVLDRIEELSRNGTAPDFKSLEQLRRLMQTPASGFTNPDQQRLARMMRESLDTFMAQTAAGTMPAVVGQTGNSAQAAALRDVREGRKLYAQAKKGELLERMFEMAEDRAASTYSGSNVENAIRQNLRKILDNDKLKAKFSADELALIRRTVRGEPVQNLMRKIGSLSPLRGGLMSVLMTGGTGAGVATMGPAAAIPAGIAAVADSLARAGTRSQAQAVSSAVRGGPTAAAQLALPSRQNPAIEAIMRALAAQSGAAVSP